MAGVKRAAKWTLEAGGSKVPRDQIRVHLAQRTAVQSAEGQTNAEQHEGPRSELVAPVATRSRGVLDRDALERGRLVEGLLVGCDDLGVVELAGEAGEVEAEDEDEKNRQAEGAEVDGERVAVGRAPLGRIDVGASDVGELRLQSVSAPVEKLDGRSSSARSVESPACARTMNAMATARLAGGRAIVEEIHASLKVSADAGAADEQDTVRSALCQRRRNAHEAGVALGEQEEALRRVSAHFSSPVDVRRSERQSAESPRG